MRKLLAKLSMALLAVLILVTVKTDAIAKDKTISAVELGIDGAAPEQIKNLTVDKNNDYSLHWNAIPGTYRYELYASGPDGYFFGSYENGAKWYKVTVGDQTSDVSTDQSVFAIMASLSSYDSNGKAVASPKPGNTYTIHVRAVNADISSNGDVTTEYPGPEATVDYKMPSIDFKYVKSITNFEFVKNDRTEGRYYFALPTQYVGTSMKVEYSYDYSFPSYRIVDLNYDSLSGLYYIPSEKIEMFENQTLYVRAFCPSYRDTNNKYSFSNITNVFVQTSKTNIGTVKKLSMSETATDNALAFTCEGDLVSDAKLVIQYSTDSSFNKWSQVPVSNSTYTLDLSALDENVTYFFKAVGSKIVDQYVWSRDGESKDEFKKSAEKATGNSNVKIYTPFSTLKKYYYINRTDVYGVPSNVVTYVKKAACTELKSFSLSYVGGTYKASYNNSDLKSDEKIQLCWSSEKDFRSGKNSYGDYYTESKIYDHRASVEGEVYLDIPARATYVKARVIKDEKNYKSGKNTQEKYFFSNWTKAVTVTGSVLPATITYHDKNASSVLVFVGSKGGVSTGIQLDMYNNGSYTKLYQGTDPYYKVTGLKANTKYKFRARRYYYNYYGKKYVYGPYVESYLVTWGSEVEVNARAQGSNAAVIEWKSVAGATGYEIYRATLEYASDSKSGKYKNYELIKSVGPSTKSYKNTGLCTNVTYSYLVKAYKTMGNQKYYVSGEDSLYLGFDNILASSTPLKNGTVKLTWKGVTTATHYTIEKYDENKNSWKTYKTVKKDVKELVLPRCSSKNKNALYDKYRVKAVNNEKKISSAYSSVIYVYPLLQAPTNVKCKETEDGSVKISWDAVSGADYYLVYKTPSSYQAYDSDSKGYKYISSTEIKTFKTDTKSNTGYKLVKKGELTGTACYDARIVEKDAFGYNCIINEGPSEGTSYYYVVACKTYPSANAYGESDIVYTSAGSEAKKITVTSKMYTPKISKLEASSGKVTITWPTYAKAYSVDIYRSSSASSEGKKIKTIIGSKTTKFEDTTVNKGSRHFYRIVVNVKTKTGTIVPTSKSEAKSIVAK